MSWQITDYDELFIEFDEGLQPVYVPKFRMEPYVDPDDSDYVIVEWVYHETGLPGQKFRMDYNDVLFGYVAPSSASELVMVLEQYMRSAFSAAPGDLLSNKGDLLTHDGASDTVLPVGTDDFVLTADSTDPNGIKWKTLPAAVNPVQTLGMTQAVIANTGLGETKLWSLLIPAGTIGINDLLETFIANTRTGGSGNVQGRIYINTADTLVGAQLINTTFTGSNTMVSSTGYRKWLNSSTSTIGMATNATGPTITVGGTRLPLTINNAVDQYVIAAINQTVGTDTTNLEIVAVRLWKYP